MKRKVNYSSQAVSVLIGLGIPFDVKGSWISLHRDMSKGDLKALIKLVDELKEQSNESQ